MRLGGVRPNVAVTRAIPDGGVAGGGTAATAWPPVTLKAVSTGGMARGGSAFVQVKRAGRPRLLITQGFTPRTSVGPIGQGFFR